MKTENQIKLTPRGAGPRNFATRTVASLALVTTTILAVVGDGSKLVAEEGTTAIRPFRVNVPKAALTDLRRRLAATRWPTKELVKDRSQGVQFATLKELVRYWATDYDWRKAETRLNAFPQFVTKIDGVDYPGLTYFNEVDRGGHFAAWEEPALFVSELRAAFKSLRGDKDTALNR